MIRISYTNTEPIDTIRICTEHYLGHLSNNIMDIRKNPNEVIQKAIASRLLSRARKILFDAQFKAISRKRNLDLHLDEALVLMQAFCHYQKTMAVTDVHLNSRIEKLKLTLDPQTV